MFTQKQMDELSASLLNAVKPSLKAPLTAVLCEKDELKITENDGIYTIEGYINSQNSYGAMIGTDFTATARLENDNWVITGTQVGVKKAANDTTNFISNYIAISIFVAIMGGIGYFILKLIYGF